MTKKELLLPAIAIAVLVVALAANSLLKPKTPEPHVVSSADGTATLEIPVDSLPDGVSPEDISVTLAESVTPDDSNDMVASVTYDLLPDGLEFLKPIRFSATVDNPAMAVPMAFISSSSGDSLELPAEKDTLINAATGKTEVSFALEHFSSVTISTDHDETKAVFTVNASVADTPVGEEVPAQATISVNPNVQHSTTHEYPDMTFTWTYTLDPSSVKLVSSFQNPDWSHLEISKPSSGSTQSTPVTGSITVPRPENARYGCEKGGPSHLELGAGFIYKYIATGESGNVVDDPFNQTIGDNIMVMTEFECLGGEEEEEEETGMHDGRTWEAFVVMLTGDFKHFSGFSEVNGTVKVASESPNPVSDATVKLKMTPEHGEPKTADVVTDANGMADFVFTIHSYGDYIVSVEDIIGDNIEYRPELNEMSSTEVQVR